MIAAGTLRHEVTIQSKSKVTGATGEVTNAWVAGDTVRASIKQLSGKEALLAKQAKSTATHNVVIRYYSGLTTSHSLLFGAKTLHIESINNVDQRNFIMELQCKESVS